MKIWTIDEIRNMLDNNDRAVNRGIVAIYKLQTESEKASESTNESNGVGFASCDARLGSYYAKWVMSGKNLNGNHLDKARKMCKKYAGQLVKLANKQG